jgi:hypothetical protein
LRQHRGQLLSPGIYVVVLAGSPKATASSARSTGLAEYVAAEQGLCGQRFRVR